METIKTVYKVGKGPSSSHTIGPDNAIRAYINKFDMDYCDIYLYGSLALTGKGHLTDFVIEEALKEVNVEHKIHFDFKTDENELGHPNTMKIVGKKDGEELDSWLIFSVGGGNIIVNGEKGGDANTNTYPHSLFNDISKYCSENNKTLVDYVNENEEEDLDAFLANILSLMFDSVKAGLSKEGPIHGDLKINRRAKKLYDGAHDDNDMRLTAYAYAVTEENATGGTIVTAPTCGACGVLPAVLYHYKYDLNYDDKKLIDALKVAGLIGTLTRHNASISGAEAGCQAEVGTATSMSAAAILFLDLENPTLIQLESAAEIAMEHNLGLTCDPILGYVQIPCIQRNAVGTIKAKTAAKIAEFTSDMEVVDFDTIIKVMYETGKDMNAGYRETSQLGLAKYFEVK